MSFIDQIESIDQIVKTEAQNLEARGIFDLIDKREWAMARYRELYAEAMADRADDFAENEWRWSEIEGSDPKDDLRAMHQEYIDSYAANELGDQLWEAGIDPWAEEESSCFDGVSVEDIERDHQIDADIELEMWSRHEDAVKAYFEKQEEDAKRAKRIREEVQKKWTF